MFAKLLILFAVLAFVAAKPQYYSGYGYGYPSYYGYSGYSGYNPVGGYSSYGSYGGSPYNYGYGYY